MLLWYLPKDKNTEVQHRKIREDLRWNHTWNCIDSPGGLLPILTALEYRPDQIETLNTTSRKTSTIYYRRFDDDPDL